MADGATSGALTGAASGAASGASVGGVYGAVIGGVIGGVGGWISGSSADAAFDNQTAWAQYNAQAAFVNNRNNANSAFALAGFNAALTRGAANRQASSIASQVSHNVQLIQLTTEYNEDLMEQQLEELWTANELELSQLAIFRARERGQIVSEQGASGTVIGQDSNGDVLVDQLTQEALDSTVVKYNADVNAAHISNEIAKSAWEGQIAIDNAMFEGQVAINNTLAGADAQILSSLGSAALQQNASLFSAKTALMAGKDNITQAQFQNTQQNNQQLISGLFGAASTGASTYYRNKSPGTGGQGGVIHSDGSESSLSLLS